MLIQVNYMARIGILAPNAVMCCLLHDNTERDVLQGCNTKMSQLGHYETIHTDRNVHWERSSRVNPREIAIINKV